MLKTRLLVGIALVVVLGACSDGDGDDSGSDTVVAEPGDEGPILDSTEGRRVRLSVTGAVSMQYDAVTDVRVVERLSRGALASASVVQVVIGPLPSPVPSADSFEVETGLVGETYTGQGSYTLPAGLGPAPTGAAPTVRPPTGPSSASVASVKFIEFGPPPSEVRFAYLLEPCRFTVSEHARTGQAACPALVASDGTKVAMDLTWEEA